jgi:hypothetical protein
MGAGSMSYVGESDTGHMTLMHARLKRLHDSMAARGASSSALARLPQLPRLAKPLGEGLPPIVLATPKNGTDYVTQAKMRAARELRGVPGYVSNRVHKAKQTIKPYRGVGYAVMCFRGETDPADLARARAIVIAAATANGINSWRIFDKRKPNQVIAVRRHCIKIALELTRLSSARMAAIFGQPDHSTIRHNHRRAKFLLNSGDPVAVKIHARALEAVYARFPEYRPTQMQEAA